MEMTYLALVIDDDLNVLTVVKGMLEHGGVGCDTANSAEQALELFEKGKYNIVLTDIQMPQMHGIQLIDELTQIDPAQAIMVMTGIKSEEIINDLFSKGVLYVLNKPFTGKLLNAVVLGILIRNNRSNARTTNYIREKVKVHTDKLETETDKFEKQISSLEEKLTTAITEFDLLNDDSTQIMKFLMTKYEDSHGLNHSNDGIAMEIAQQIGIEMNLSNSDLRDLAMAAILRDIGKVKLPKDIKASHQNDLKDKPRAAYEQHPIISAKLLRTVPNFENIASAIETHHENHDGSGYPKGMHTDELPIINKILRVAVGINGFREKNKFENEDDWQTGLKHLNRYSDVRYAPEISKVASLGVIEIERKLGGYVIEEIEFSDLEKGQRLAEDISMTNGTFLIRQGKVLSKAIILRLNNEINKIIVKDKVKVFVKNDSDN